ncbi:MAG TPA: flagellar biosynthesis protein FlhB [Bacteroidota bacterium]|nr:flagellar biosynthesis protein FlhB [Bacteroidota bacterium]
MAEASFAERTEPATDKKRADARKKGKVFRSQELNSAAVLVFSALLLSFAGGGMASGIADMARELFGTAGTFRVTAAGARELLVREIVRFGVIALPVLGGVAAAGLALNLAQVGFSFTLEPMMPELARINPLSGIKRVLGSRRSWVELLKNVLKVTLVGYIAWDALQGILADAVTLMDGDPGTIVAYMGHGAISLALKTGLAFLVMAALDYAYQRFEYEKELRMTKQEVKDEAKQQEGDPQVKARVRSIQRRIAYRRMMQDVPTADVVVTNPTHVAVALKYDTEKMSAPKVVASGADLVAQKIREIAAENGVPIVEDRPLARALFQSVEVGEEIPEKLFQAVAQVLAYIYRLKGDAAGWRMN